jgi:acyl transferase domain-containing protein
MDPALDDFTRAVAEQTLEPPTIPYVSGLTGTWITPAEATAPSYFSRLLRGTVRFSDGLRTLGRLGRSILLEIGPGRSLTTLAKQHDALWDHVTLATLRAAPEVRRDRAVLLETLGELWLEGVAIDWQAVAHDHAAQRVALPTYPFERREHWVPRAGQAGQAQAPDLPGVADAATAPATAGATAPALASASAPAGSALAALTAILGAPTADRAARLTAYITRTLNGLRGHPAAHPVDPRAALADLGFDSLALIRLREQLQADLRVAMPIRDLLGSSVESLAGLLAARLEAAGR